MRLVFQLAIKFSLIRGL